MAAALHPRSLFGILGRLKRRLRRFHGVLFIRSIASLEGAVEPQGVFINREVSPPRLAMYSRVGAVYRKRRSQAFLDGRGVLIIQQGRFGNSFQQVTNAIRFASAMQIERIFIEPNEWLERQALLGSGLQITHLSRSERLPQEVKQLFVGRFLWREEISFANTVVPECTIGHLLSEHLSVRPDESLRKPNVLVVHLRGGDVYSKKPAKDYGQPPIGFYQRIISDYDWARVHIVHEDNQPVVLGPLLSWCQGRVRTVTHQSGDLRSDLGALLGASNLVVSNGSFGRAACHLNPRLARVFRMEGTYDLGRLDEKVLEISIEDSRRDYVEAVLSLNWKNSSAQRALMVNYSAENFEIKDLGNSASRESLGE